MVMLAGCGRVAPPATIVVQGGPSLGPLFADLGAAYETVQPDTRLELKFSCPPCMLFKDGADAVDLDIFASIGQFEAEQLVRAKVARFSEQVLFGRSSLSLVAASGAEGKVKSLADIASAKDLRVGIGDPEETAIGFYARHALQNAGLWDALKGRLEYSQSGCELLKWLGLGRRIDVAVVFSVCEADETTSPIVVETLPADVSPPVPLVLALSSDTEAESTCREFIDFVQGPDAADILRKHKVEPLSGHD